MTQAQPTTIPGMQTTYTVRGAREISTERTYAAPRDLVYKTFCDPKRVAAWWGPPGWNTRVEAFDVRPGGTWRILQRDPRGGEHVYSGIFREVEPGKRIVATFEYGGAPGMSIMETYEFIEKGDRTLLRVTSVFPSGAALGGMLSVGMETAGRYPEGVRHQWRLERLADLVEA